MVTTVLTAISIIVTGCSIVVALAAVRVDVDIRITVKTGKHKKK